MAYQSMVNWLVNPYEPGHMGPVLGRPANARRATAIP